MVSTFDRAPLVWGSVNTIEALSQSSGRGRRESAASGSARDQEAGEVALVCLDAFLKYLEAVEIGGILATHRTHVAVGEAPGNEGLRCRRCQTSR